MLTKSGAKVLDFGVARAVRFVHSQEAETLTKALTSDGIDHGTTRQLAGTIPQGREVDSRSDIFSFGAVAIRDGVGATGIRGREYGERHRQPYWNANPRLPAIPGCNRIYRGGWTGLWRPASQR